MPRRRDVSSCATDAAYNNSSYDLPLHVGAVFIVLAVSSLACAFPLLVLRFPRLRIPQRALFAARHFGTGVLLATAFVHLLPTAFQSLGDPCLSDFWTVDYPAMPGAVALGAIFLIAGLEMVFSPEKGCCAMPVEEAGRVSGARPNACCSGPEDGNVAGRANDCHGSPSNPETLPVHSSQSPAQEPEAEANVDLDDLKHGLSPEQEHKKALMQCLLLEMGILFHSVFIGMNLSVSTGREFVVLLVAIIFHRKLTSKGRWTELIKSL